MKFRPNPGESGYAYQVMTIVFTDTVQTSSNLRVVDYVINVLPSSPGPLTVTATAQGALSVTPSGAQGVQVGATPSFQVTATDTAGAIALGGTCPRGTWSGNVYTITEPLKAGCSVDFRPSTVTVTESHDQNLSVTPYATGLTAFGGTASFTVSTASASFALPTTVGGTCAAGTWSGDVYTTGTITQPCTVKFQAKCLLGDSCTRLFTNRTGGTASATYGGSGGGAFGPDVCPPGYAMVGLSGRVGGNIGAVAGVCGEVLAVVAGGVTTVQVASPQLTLPTHGADTASTPFSLLCPAGSVVTRVDGYADAVSPGAPVTTGAHDSSVFCSALSWSGSNVAAGPPTLAGRAQSSWSMASSTPFSFACSGSGTVAALRGRAGSWLDALGFTCFAP